MSIVESIKTTIDKFINPIKYETELERKERHRREDMKHQIEMAKIKHGVKTGSAEWQDPFSKELEGLDKFAGRKSK